MRKKKFILTGLVAFTLLAGISGIVNACANDKSKGTIIVDKVAPSGGSQSFVFTTTGDGYSGFSLTDAATPNSQDLKPGTYSVAETPTTGWTLTSAICKKVKDYGWGGDCDGKVIDPSHIVLGADETIKCIFTNTKNPQPQPGSITIKKLTVGGDDTFTFTGDVSGSLMNGNSTTTQVMAGTYTSTESQKDGWALTDISCSDTDSTGSIATGIATFKVGAGENVTCTFTNTKKPTLTIVKEVEPETGDPGKFNLFINDMKYATDVGDDGTTGPQFANIGSNTFKEMAGTGTDLDDYTSAVTGDGCGGDGTITLKAGDAKTCTITNTAKQGTLIVKKAVNNNHGGTLDADDFSFQVNGGTAVAFEEDGENDIQENAGTYTVTETATPGYTATYDNCKDVQVTPGGTTTCTITNDDIAPSLTLFKKVIDGIAQPGDWTLTASASSTVELSGTSPVVSGADFKAGTYVLSESSVENYVLKSITCVDGLGNPYAGLSGMDLTIGLGDQVTCNFNNNDPQATTLIVSKHVINDNGGTATADQFNISVNGHNVAPKSFAGSEDGTTVILDVDQPFTISETGPSGYAKTMDAACTGPLVAGTINYCHIVNNDIAPSLTLVKQTNCGIMPLCTGKKACADPKLWTLTATDVDATSTLAISGPTPASSGPGFMADDYVLGETGGPDGYDPGDWNCTVNGHSMTLAGGAITLGLGDVAACTIINSKIATPPSTTGKIKVVKYAIGGKDTFGFSVNGTPAFTIATTGVKFGNNSQGSWLLDKLTPGTVYSITETTLPSGWKQVINTCKSVKPKAGRIVTCVVVNKKIQQVCAGGKLAWWQKCYKDTGRYNDVFHGMDFDRDDGRGGKK